MISINISQSGVNSFVPSAPTQQVSIADTTNPKFPRYMSVSQDGVRMTFFTQSVFVPKTQLYAAAVNAIPGLTWPPIILTQPVLTQSVVHPTSSFFFISASAEIPITYQWFSQSLSQSFTSSTNYFALSNGGPYTGSTTNALTHSFTSTTDNSSSFLCVATNLAGNTTSSISTLYVL